MQKRILWGAAALVLLLVFAGCSQPTDFTYSGASPGNPGSLTADVSYEGLVLLSWRQVASASKYTVYRYDTVTKKERLLGDVAINAANGSLFYTDFVGRDNQLVDGQNYEYTVVAVNNSFGTSGMPLKNGSSKVTAKPKIPAEGSAVTANLDVEIGPGGAGVLVKFNNQPNLSYSIEYVYGTNQLVYATTGTGITGDEGDVWIFEKTRYLTFPSFGGDGIVTVKYGFAGGGWLTGGTAKSEEISFAIGADGPGPITSFVVTRGEDYARYTWEGGAGATKFEIYKAQVSEEPAFVTGATVSINFISDWELVTITPPELNNAEEWVAKEALTSNAGNYAYALKAINDNGSSGKFAYATPVPTYRPQIIAQLRSGTNDKVQLSWEGDEDATYVLERCIADSLDGLTPVDADNFVLRDPGVYTPVDFGKPEYLLGWAVVVDEPEANESYVYKLTATKFGVSAPPTFAVINDGVFTNETSFSIDIYTGDDIANNAVYDALAVVITYTGDDNRNIARSINLYRRVEGDLNAGNASPYRLLTPTPISWSEGQETYIYEDNVPDISVGYNYRIVVDGGVINNDGQAQTVNWAGKDISITETGVLHAYSYEWTAGETGGTKIAVYQNATNVDDLNKTLAVTGATQWTFKSGTVILAVGHTTSDIATTPTDEFENVGPSIEGLHITVEYAVHDLAAPAPLAATVPNYGTVERTLEIKKATGTALTDTPAAGQSTTYFVYFIELGTVSDSTNVTGGEPTFGAYGAPGTGTIPADAYDDDYIIVKGYTWGAPPTTALPTAADDKVKFVP